ncbi:MAG: Uma2 family endonuclease [Saprospirales bacterium]|nr:Uma2 family endonuclease [Saprospirales bacterium]MBK8922072.1 Uma2 family endonuclease [Saprospirales bacterium]
MSAIQMKFPLTHEELLAIGQGELLRFPASFAEYWGLLQEARYKADYSNGEIVAMSYETNVHSKIVMQLAVIFDRIFDSQLYAIHDSNRPVYIADFQAVHNPDCSVVLEPAQLFEYQPGMNAETTPLVLVEVLSKTTRDYDYSEKLPHYKQIPSLRQIIYIESAKMFVSVYERTDEGPHWVNTDYSRPEDSFLVGGQAVKMEEIYRKVTF